MSLCCGWGRHCAGWDLETRRSKGSFCLCISFRCSELVGCVCICSDTRSCLHVWEDHRRKFYVDSKKCSLFGSWMRRARKNYRWIRASAAFCCASLLHDSSHWAQCFTNNCVESPQFFILNQSRGWTVALLHAGACQRAHQGGPAVKLFIQCRAWSSSCSIDLTPGASGFGPRHAGRGAAAAAGADQAAGGGTVGAMSVEKQVPGRLYIYGR